MLLKASVWISVISILLLFAGLPRIASAQVAPGVSNSAAQTATIAGNVTQSSGLAVVGADVKLVGPTVLSTRTDARGAFLFTSVIRGVYSIIVNALGFGRAELQSVTLNGDIDVVIRYPTQAGGIKTLATISTRSVGAHINVTSASIASVRPSEYAFQGNASWQHLVDQIPGVTVGGALYAGTTAASIIPGSVLQPTVLSINGALPYETATMLDGMPLENLSYNALPGNGVDLSYLPMPTFETADVVRGPGADAPSILDSIGGSFVLHPPGRVDVNHSQLSVSNDQYGGSIFNAKVALRLGPLSTTVVYGTYNSPGPLGSQSILPADLQVPMTVNGQQFTGCGPSYVYGCYNLPTNSAGFQNCFCELQDALLYCCFTVNTGWTQHNGAVGLSYDIVPWITAGIFYAGSSSRTDLPLAGYPVDFTPGPGYTGSIQPGLHRYISAAGPVLSAQADSLLEEKLTASVGNGVLRFAALQNYSFVQQLIPDELPDGQYRLYGTGYFASSPTTAVNFNGTPVNLTFSPFQNNYYAWTNNRDILASYATEIGPKSFAGLSYVRSYYNYPYNFTEVFGTSQFSGDQSSAISETTDEVRLHAGTEVSNKLSLDASWYFAFGVYHVIDPANQNLWANSTFTYNAPRFSAVWRASPDVSIRGAAGGGYALPALFQLIGTNFTVCTTYCAQTLTNLKLKPEESFGFDLGTDIRLRPDTVFSFDAYRSNLYGQFFQSTGLTGTLNGLPLYTTQYSNLLETRYEGINLAIERNATRGIYWRGSLALTRAYAVSLPPGFYDSPATGPNSINTYIIPNINFDGEFQSTVPYSMATAKLGYRWRAGAYVDLSPTYYGNNNPYFQPAFTELDAHASYPIAKYVSILATVSNATGVHGQNYLYYDPKTILGAPTIAGLPLPEFALPYGPRALIVTLNFNH